VGKVYALVVAAGKGERMASDISKQFLFLCGKPVLLYSLEIFDSIDAIDEIVLVVAADNFSYVAKEVLSYYNFRKKVTLIKGGYDRQQSVFNGLNAISSDADYVVIHDGVRPLITQNVVIRGLNAALSYGAAAIGVPVKDTIKEVDSENFILCTPKRDSLWMIQTPQIFKYEIILTAHKKALSENFRGTDDSILAELSGVRVKIVQGSYSNIKITTSEDLILAQELIRRNDTIVT